MREFDVPGLNTTRDAQQLLVREGLTGTERGVGAWVTAQTSPTVDQALALQALREAGTQLDQAIAYPKAQDEGRWSNPRVRAASAPSTSSATN